MQVLVKNTNARLHPPGDLVPSFWDPDIFYMGPTFSISSMMNQSDPVGLAPYFLLDAKTAFVMSLLKKGQLLTRGLGPLAAVAAFMRAREGFIFEGDQKARTYISEYLPYDPLKECSLYDQVIAFGESSIDEYLWKKLAPHGTYIIASLRGPLKLNDHKFDARGRIWPLGEATEWGWKFHHPELGLDNFEIAKLEKLD
jgi:hypothetical protein